MALIRTLSQPNPSLVEFQPVSVKAGKKGFHSKRKLYSKLKYLKYSKNIHDFALVFGRVICLKYAQRVILRILARLVFYINIQELVSSTRLKPEPRFADTCYTVGLDPIWRFDSCSGLSVC